MATCEDKLNNILVDVENIKNVLDDMNSVDSSNSVLEDKINLILSFLGLEVTS